MTTRTRKHVTDSQRWRIALLAEWGFYGRTIARRVFGNGDTKYEPTDADVRRVYTITKQEGIQISAWRRGENESAKRILNQSGRCSTSSPKWPKLRIA
jgi:hypothetical protein